MDAAKIVGITAGISTVLTFILTFVVTKLWDAYSMQKKYRTKGAAERCMKEREEAETAINKALAEIKKRLILGNLVMADLCDEAKIPQSKILSYEKALGMKLRDNDE